MSAVRIGTVQYHQVDIFLSDGVLFIEIIFISCRTYFRDNNGMLHFFKCDSTDIIRTEMKKRKKRKKMTVPTTIIMIMTTTIGVMKFLFLFLLIDKRDKNNFILNSYLMIVIIYTIFDGIYQLLNHLVIENKTKNSNTFQDKLTCNARNICLQQYQIMYLNFFSTYTRNILKK